jgi:Leucine-rich repeat (LRR) protein
LTTSAQATVEAVPNIPEYEFSALYQLYNSTNGANWNWQGTGSTWIFSSTANPCADDWAGVSCILPYPYTVSFVSELNLEFYNLRGPLPDAIGSFQNLSVLDLSYNNITGTIPRSISNLTFLTVLDLAVNSLTGSIPESLCTLSKLTNLTVDHNFLNGSFLSSILSLSAIEYVGLSHNLISGNIPEEMGTLLLLSKLDLSWNSLSGTIPPSVGNLSSLTYMDISWNQITGPLPLELGDLPAIEVLRMRHNVLNSIVPLSWVGLSTIREMDISDNDLSGSLPAWLGSLHSLSTFEAGYNLFNGTFPAGAYSLGQLSLIDVQNNKISGSFPLDLCDLTALTFLDLSANEFDGVLPSCLGQLAQLTVLALDRSGWSGTLPAELGNLTELVVLSLSSCDLHGAVPDALVGMQSMIYLDLSNNALTGPFPEFLGRLSLFPAQLEWLPSLQLLSLSNNFLEGQIPAALGDWGSLRFLDLGDCAFVGTLPPELGNLSSLLYFRIGGNDLTGTIPDSYGSMRELAFMLLYSNRLSGTVPATFSSLSGLTELALQGNQLVGDIEGIFDPATQTRLQTVNIAGNPFTGAVPSAVFQLPQLQVFLTAGNCFHGSLSTAICNAKTLLTLQLNALHSATACQTRIFRGIDTYITKNAVAGTIPQCLFELPLLQTLELSSNALTGTLSANLSFADTMQDLVLSYNLIIGTIPESIQRRSWASLDLSNNRFGGTLSAAFPSVLRPGSGGIFLQYNKLSGVLPGSFDSAQNISVLKSNIFSCNFDHSDLPPNDPYVNIYQCASDTTDVPYYEWLACTGAAAALIGALWWWKAEVNARVNVVSLIVVVRGWLESEGKAGESHYAAVYSLISDLRSVGLQCALYAVILLAPLYAILTAYYGTHTYEYIWTVSAVLKGGAVPLALEFVLLFALLTAFLLAFLPLARARTRGEELTVPVGFNGENAALAHRLARLGAFVLINFSVVSLVNIRYVFLKLNSTPIFQLTISAFKVVWNGLCSPALSRYLLHPRAHNSVLELFVALCNTIVIPVLTVAFVSPDCFYHAFEAQDVTSITVSSNVCVALDGSTCLQKSPIVQFVSINATFVYNYQCSYVFAEFYVPAFIYVCLFSTFGIPLLEVTLAALYERAVPGTRWFALLDRIVPKILKLTTAAAPEGARPSPLRPYFDATQFVIMQLTYLCLLMTFGAVFPPLAAAIYLTMVVTTLTLRMKVGRFLRNAAECGHGGYLEIIEQECRGVASYAALKKAMWMIIVLSAAFYSLFMFDTFGASTGFNDSFWVLIVFPLMSLVLYCIYSIVRRARPELLGPPTVDAAAEADGGASSGTEDAVPMAKIHSGALTVATTATPDPGDSVFSDTFNVLNAQL